MTKDRKSWTCIHCDKRQKSYPKLIKHQEKCRIKQIKRRMKGESK